MIFRRCTVADVVPLRMAVLRPGLPASASHWTGDDEPDTRHYAADDDRVIGIASVLLRPAPDGFASRRQLRGMAVDPHAQRSGIGRGLLEFAVQDVGEPMWCNARVSAIGFYERQGWRIVSEPFEIAGAGPHVWMRTC